MTVTTADEPSGLRISIRGRAHFMTCASAIVWSAGWLAFEAVLLSGALRDDRSVGVVLILAAWTGIGAFAIAAIAWAAAGKPAPGGNSVANGKQTAPAAADCQVTLAAFSSGNVGCSKQRAGYIVP